MRVNGKKMYNILFDTVSQMEENNSSELLRKHTYWALRFCNETYESILEITKDESAEFFPKSISNVGGKNLDMLYGIFHYELENLKKITYKDFINVFPITKTYDGARYEIKDYFSVMEYLKGKDLDSQIDNPLEFLFAYQNDITDDFIVNYMVISNRVMRCEIGIDPVEAFFFPENYAKDNRGNIIGVTSDGKVHKLPAPECHKSSKKCNLSIVK